MNPPQWLVNSFNSPASTQIHPHLAGANFHPWYVCSFIIHIILYLPVRCRVAVKSIQDPSIVQLQFSAKFINTGHPTYSQIFWKEWHSSYNLMDGWLNALHLCSSFLVFAITQSSIHPFTHIIIHWWQRIPCKVPLDWLPCTYTHKHNLTCRLQGSGIIPSTFLLALTHTPMSQHMFTHTHTHTHTHTDINM